MRKKIGCGLLCLVMILAMCGCGEEPAEPTEETTEFTIPTLNETQTPDEILRSAATRSKELTAFFADYVRILHQERFAHRHNPCLLW